MKRSEINTIIREADAFMRGFGFSLPPFADWSPEEFRRRRPEAEEILSARLGWDVTDFGRGDFDGFGLFLFTLRNGSLADRDRGRGRLFAEKLLICRPGQMTPMHRHNIKVEDIIVRGGGDAVFDLHMADEKGGIDRAAEVVVRSDGIVRRLAPGTPLVLSPGQSVTLTTNIWHSFHAKDSQVLFGEVSTVNDDVADNVFLDPIGRFSEVEEDEPPLRLLVSDYDRALAA